MATDAKTVYAYEPDYAVPPGETLQETINALGMTQKELAIRTGLTPKTINQIIKGEHPLSRETAIKLERATGVPTRMWNTLEMNYREGLARIADHKRLEAALDHLKAIPVRELIRRGAIEGTKDKVELLARVLRFFGVSGWNEWEQVGQTKQAAAFRTSKRLAQEPGPTLTWLRLGELAAQAISCRPYDRDAFVEALCVARSLTMELPAAFKPELVDLCAGAGVAVVFVPQIRGCPAHGVTRWLTPEKALVQLSLRYRSDDQFWFSFFHEAGHVLYSPKRAITVDLDGARDAADERADRFAANLLIPSKHAASLRELRSEDDIRRFARRIGIAPGIVVGRLQKEGRIPYSSRLNALKRRFVWRTE